MVQHDDDDELPTAPRDTMRYEIETLPTELGAAHVRERCSLYLGRQASDMWRDVMECTCNVHVT